MPHCWFSVTSSDWLGAAATVRVAATGHGLDREVLAHLLDHRIRPHDVREQAVRRVHDEHADLAEQVVDDGSARSRDERDRVVVRDGVVAADGVAAHDRVVAEHRVGAVDRVLAVDRVIAREDDQMPLRLGGAGAARTHRGRADEQDECKHESRQSVSLEHVCLPSD